MREPFQRRDPDQLKPIKMEDINFRDFAIYRHIRLEKISPGGWVPAKARLALKMMTDPRFPADHVFTNALDVMRYVMENPHYTCSNPRYRQGELDAARSMWSEYTDFRIRLDLKLPKPTGLAALFEET